MKKREIFLYFTQKGKGSNFYNPHGYDHPSASGGHVVTTTEVGTTWNGDAVQDVPIDDIFDRANKGTQGSITRVSVKSAGDNTGNRGSGYTATTEVPGGKVASTAADTVAGQITVLNAAAYPAALAGSAGSEKLRVKKATGSAGDTTRNLMMTGTDLYHDMEDGAEGVGANNSTMFDGHVWRVKLNL